MLQFDASTYNNKRFPKYQHIERLGTDDVGGLLDGYCYVQPKIDGTNGVIWFDNGLQCGSRNRILSLEDDNQGFCAYVNSNPNIKEFIQSYKDYVLYGEYLIRHTIKDYVKTAWNKFYVFDVAIWVNDTKLSYIPYNDYKDILVNAGFEVIPVMAEGENIAVERLIQLLQENHYLMKEGTIGEGLVIKRYDYVNKYGFIKWGKIKTEVFAKKHRDKEMYEKEQFIEARMVNKYMTEEFCLKTLEKVREKNNGFSSKNIAELLGTIYHDFVVEETWNIVKENKKPKIDFRLLNHFVVSKAKEYLSKEIGL